MQKLLVICGPTSTGKTTLALKLAKKFNGELVSADSRQVYKGMDIGTGKDLPKNSKMKFLWFNKYGYYDVDGIKIWGYDLADPRHEFSVAQYIKFTERIIPDIVKRGKLPIVVGGTGLYIKAIIDGIATASIPKNNLLRKNLDGKNPEELFEQLAQLDSFRAGEMNSSDKKNPRRLVRAIEVAMWKTSHIEEGRKMDKKKINITPLIIGLSAPEKFIDERINLRVKDRVEKGIKDEVAKLLKSHVGWEMQSMTSMGYGEWRDFFEGEVPEEQVISEWERAERAYAKRQMTWFSKDKRIKWHDITLPGYPEMVEKSVEKWYSTSDNEKS